MTERYASRGGYEAAIREAASKLVANRLLLAQDVSAVTEEALRAYDNAVERDCIDHGSTETRPTLTAENHGVAQR